MAYGILVREVMTQRPVTVKPDETVMGSIKKMLKKGVGSVIVVNGKKEVKGIFTEKDAIARVLAKSRDPKKTKISKVMTKRPVVVDPWIDMEQAAELMNEKEVRRLPVIEEGKLAGLITQKDMLKTEPQVIDVLKEKLMIREPESKPIYDDVRFESGVCEVCSNYSDSLQYTEGMWVCEECLDQIS